MANATPRSTPRKTHNVDLSTAARDGPMDPGMNHSQIDTPLTRAQTRIEEDFAAMGGVTIYLSEEGVSADDWRKLMRLVARRLGRPVETFATDVTVVGALKDWPATEGERQRSMRNQRRAIESLSDPL